MQIRITFRIEIISTDLSQRKLPHRAFLAELATLTGHHCPATFAAEIRKLDRPARWLVVHRKPRYAAQIAAELAALDLPGVELVRPGEPLTF